MKSNSRDRRFLLLLVLSLLASFGSVFYSSTLRLPAHELGIVTTNTSDYRETIVWGAPLRVVIDKLNSANISDIDAKDDFSGAAFLFNWLVYFALAWPLYFMVHVLFRFLVRFVETMTGATAKR